ncbi:DUF1610 domain-containing protein [Candidatus Woesearchaeota archaeon]|nr:DUF1610 domain-containing protein [Candidatus Woesearchaeota archaeon]
MAERSKRCVSCNKEITNDTGSVEFKCPGCNKQVIIRCSQCKKLATKYKCKECGFSGPN